MTVKKNILLLTLCLLLVFASYAQLPIKERKSPLALVTIKYKTTYVKVTYSQPHKRGRKIMGELVPYGEVWRTGANETTEITLTRAMIVGTDTLKAGTYSIFTIPDKNFWTVIFNSQLGQWGAYNYHQPSDVLRLKVPVETIDEVVYEPFTISFDQQNDKATMWLRWERTQVAVPIRFIQ